MGMEDGKHLVVPVEMEGEPSGIAALQSVVKLTTQPYLVIAVPCGDKELKTQLTCPENLGGCGQEYMIDGYRYPHLVPLHWHIAMTNMKRPLNIATLMMWEAGKRSTDARQRMTREAIKLNAKYILYVDDDTLPEQESLYTLMHFMESHPEAGAVSGVYVSREHPPVPHVYKEHGKGHYWDLEIGPYAEPEQVFGVGAGFLLARVSAIKDTIEKLKYDNDGKEVPMWADETFIPNVTEDGTKRTIDLGHDIRFCWLLNSSGWPVYADGRVLCKHFDFEHGLMFELPDDYPGRKRYRDRMEAEFGTPKLSDLDDESFLED